MIVLIRFDLFVNSEYITIYKTKTKLEVRNMSKAVKEMHIFLLVCVLVSVFVLMIGNIFTESYVVGVGNLISVVYVLACYLTVIFSILELLIDDTPDDSLDIGKAFKNIPLKFEMGILTSWYVVTFSETSRMLWHILAVI